MQEEVKAVEQVIPAVTEDDRHLIRNSLKGAVGSCGVVQFVGCYKIRSEEYAKTILEEIQREYKTWSIYCLASSDPYVTERITPFMLAAGWTILKVFKQAHSDGMMTLWGGQGIKP